MELKEYQERAMSTCMESCDNFAYMSYGLMGEVGEFMGKIAKFIRQEKTYITDNTLMLSQNELCIPKMTTEESKALIAELGDCLWFVAGLAKSLGWGLEDVAQMNLDKLASRNVRNVIDGDGDNR